MARFAAAVLWVLPVAVLLLVQTAFALREPLFSPVDEVHHTDYLRIVAEEGRLPVYGQDEVSPLLLSIYFHDFPKSTVPTAAQLDAIGLNRVSYEALQFPLYYIAAAPLYRLLDGPDPRPAIYAERLLNVALSGLLMVLLMRLLHRHLEIGPVVSGLIGALLLLMPGAAVRNSQITNQVLVAVAITILTAWILVPRTATERGRPFREGLLMGIATMTKLTAAGVAPALAWSLLRLHGRRAWGLAACAAGALMPIALWLAWSLPTYGSPLPWTNRPLAMWAPFHFSFPTSLQGWHLFLRTLVHYFWFPWDWRLNGPRAALVERLAEDGGTLAIGASLVCAVWVWVRRRDGAATAAVALLSLLGMTAGYAYISLLRHLIYETDLREFYTFVGALALSLGLLARRLPSWISILVFGALTVAWLTVDFAILTNASCFRCQA